MDYDRLADLPLTIEAYELERYERATASGFTRVSSVVRLRGRGETGRGEDVTYDAADHDRLHDAHATGWRAAITGEWTVDTFADRLEEVELFRDPPDRPVARRYRRWAFESAALDLALRQANSNLARALDRAYRPVQFVVSTRLGDAGVGRLDRLLDASPELAFKLDPTPDWEPSLIQDLADRYGDRIRILDLKGHYEGTSVETRADPELYRRVLEAFPRAIVEDPAVTPETRELLEPAADRLSWDAPITGVADLESLPYEPRWLNVKPSRFGSMRSLCETLTYATEHDISLYGGGQFELAVGREHIQAIASVYYPDGPNDVAPGGYNDPDPARGLPDSPLEPPSEPAGFAWH